MKLTEVLYNGAVSVMFNHPGGSHSMHAAFLSLPAETLLFKMNTSVQRSSR